MQLLLIESGKKLLQTAERASVSNVTHDLAVWSAVSLTSEGRRLPADEREARVFFLLPPDRVDVRERQFEIIHLGKLGGDPQDGGYLLNPDPGWVRRQIAHGSRGKRKDSGARGKLPFGPSAPYVPD